MIYKLKMLTCAQALYSHLTTATRIAPLPKSSLPPLLWPELEKLGDITNKTFHLCKFLVAKKLSHDYPEIKAQYIFPTLFLVFTCLQILLPLLSSLSTCPTLLIDIMSTIGGHLASLLLRTLQPVLLRLLLLRNKPSPPLSMSSMMPRPTPSMSIVTSQSFSIFYTKLR